MQANSDHVGDVAPSLDDLLADLWNTSQPSVTSLPSASAGSINITASEEEKILASSNVVVGETEREEVASSLDVPLGEVWTTSNSALAAPPTYQSGGFGDCMHQENTFQPSGPMMASPNSRGPMWCEPHVQLPNQLGCQQPRGVNMQPVSEVVNNGSAPSTSAALSRNTSKSKKRNAKRQQGAGSVQPYVKRPPNAFMIFMRMSRQKIKTSMNLKHNSEIHEVLGQMWNAMTIAEQTIYFQMAEEERRRHARQHPNWCAKDNYRRNMKMSGAATTAASPEPRQQGKRRSVTVEHESQQVEVDVCHVPMGSRPTVVSSLPKHGSAVFQAPAFPCCRH